MEKNSVVGPLKQTAASLTSAPEDKSRPADVTLRLYADPEYRLPTPEDIRAVVHMLGMTAEELALLVGVKDGRAVRRWLAPATAKSHAQIDYAIWRLMLLEAGLVEPPKPLIHAKVIRSKRPILNLTEEQSQTSQDMTFDDRRK
jgi:hypothetical protein